MVPQALWEKVRSGKKLKIGPGGLGVGLIGKLFLPKERRPDVKVREETRKIERRQEEKVRGERRLES